MNYTRHQIIIDDVFKGSAENPSNVAWVGYKASLVKTEAKDKKLIQTQTEETSNNIDEIFNFIREFVK